MPASLRFFHGTSSAAVEAARVAGGLDRPFLAASVELAAYYAEVTSEEDGSAPVVVEVAGVDVARLRYDAAAMDEPVLADEALRDRAWQTAETLHPEWAQAGYLSVPADAWWVSWLGVGSVRYDGVLTSWTQLD